MRIHFHLYQGTLPLVYSFIGCSNEMEDTPDGHQENILEWCNRGGSVHREATGIQDT